MKKASILERLGLSAKESAIYVALLELGPASISAISQKTSIHRPLVYQALPGLLEKGLVTKSPKGKQVRYVAEPPEKIETLLKVVESEVRDVIPELKSIYRTDTQKPLVKFLEGRKGIAAVFDDLVSSLPRGGVFYRYSSAKDQKKADSYLLADYRARRDQKQLERFVITSEARAQEKKPRLEREIKTVPKEFDLFEHNITQVIYGTKVAFIDYNTETVVVIDNPKFAEFQTKIFRLLFRFL